MALGQLDSQRSGYAIHALCYMAKKSAGELTTLPELAEWLKSMWPATSETYLSNVIQRLARGGVLRSHRGIAGGYSLARSAKEITLRDVIELLEGVALDRCGLSLEGECPVEGFCRIQRKLRRIEEGYLSAMEQLSIAELAKDLTVKPSKQART
jgi:Rrf2 family protein